MISEQLDKPCVQQDEGVAEADALLPLVIGRATHASASAFTGGLIVGELIGLTDNSSTALVVYPNQVGSAAVPARTTVDLHSAHVGKKVALMFDSADPLKPIVIGVLRQPDANSNVGPSSVEIDRDGERMIVAAKDQLVLRCGKASITLTRDGKVLIQGAYVSSRSTGVNRVKGGSVQLN